MCHLERVILPLGLFENDVHYKFQSLRELEQELANCGPDALLCRQCHGAAARPMHFHIASGSFRATGSKLWWWHVLRGHTWLFKKKSANLWTGFFLYYLLNIPFILEIAWLRFFRANKEKGILFNWDHFNSKWHVLTQPVLLW